MSVVMLADDFITASQARDVVRWLGTDADLAHPLALLRDGKTFAACREIDAIIQRMIRRDDVR